MGKSACVCVHAIVHIVCLRFMLLTIFGRLHFHVSEQQLTEYKFVNKQMILYIR